MSFHDCLQNYHGVGFTFSVGNVPFGIKIDGGKRSEIVFAEKCINIADFRIAILVPDSTLSCDRDRPFRSWILSKFGYRATVDISNGKGGIFHNSSCKTSIMVVDKKKPLGNYQIFMAIAKKDQDMKLITMEFLKFLESQSLKPTLQ